MQFINKLDFEHNIFGDIVRINYPQDTPKQLINDFGYSYIMITYGKFRAWEPKGKEIIIPKIFTKCTGDYFLIEAEKNCSWISVELPTHLFHKITDLNAKDSRNNLFNLYNLLPKELLDKIYLKLKYENNIDVITTIFEEELAPYWKNWCSPSKSTPVIDYIFDKKGLLNTKELSTIFPYSKKTLERIFAKEVGASPYNFTCLVRFNNIIRDLQNNLYDSLEDLTTVYNYYDKSHFEKDFKKFLGQSSKSYSNNFNPLLTNSLLRIYNK